jgi:hypothetical protein
MEINGRAARVFRFVALPASTRAFGAAQLDVSGQPSDHVILSRREAACRGTQ